MEQKDIMHLATLARMRITEAEAEAFAKEVDSVLSYVSDINSITADAALTKEVGARFNIFREDVVTNEGENNTEALLSQAPKREGRYVKVKKILQAD